MPKPRIFSVRLRYFSHYLRSLPTLTLLSASLLVVLLVACAPATSTVAPTQPAGIQPSPTALPALPATDIPARATAIPTEALAPTTIPVATSRGPELHATDPSTVDLASGGLQFVEFFRFT